MREPIAYRARRLALRWQIPVCIGAVLLLTAYAMLAASLVVQSFR